jgi:histidinol dehydrogenase
MSRDVGDERSTTELALPVENLETLALARRAALLGRGRGRLRELAGTVRAVLEDVRARGDTALLEYSERFDRARPEPLRVPAEIMQAALAAADPTYRAALEQAAATIAAFHRAQLVGEPPVETTPGVSVWRVWRPIERVGVYVPGGGAIYPSCLLMAAIPARVAGCRELVVCTPPDRTGRIPAPVLAAAALAGVGELYAVGGAQAIAAMAHGTETIRPVDKIFGAGGPYVTAAKALVASEVAIDALAGPSEILVLADGTADPEWVAADLLAQAEHIEGASLLVATSPALAEGVRAAMLRQLPALASAEVIRANLAARGALLVAATMDAALEFTNAYAPEHLAIVVADAEALLARVEHAGSVFLGRASPVAAGDYASGGNHTLPTAGYARGFGPLAIESFGRKMQVQRLSTPGLAGLRGAIETLATVEGLPAHAASIAVRFDPSATSAERRAHTTVGATLVSPATIVTGTAAPLAAVATPAPLESERPA